MAAFLYRLGRLAFRRRWYVLLIWVVVLGGVGFATSRAPAAQPGRTAIPHLAARGYPVTSYPAAEYPTAGYPAARGCG